MKRTALFLEPGRHRYELHLAADPPRSTGPRFPWSRFRETYPGVSTLYEYAQRRAQERGERGQARRRLHVLSRRGATPKRTSATRSVKGGRLERRRSQGKTGYIRNSRCGSRTTPRTPTLRYQWKTDNTRPASNTSTCASTARNGRSTAILQLDKAVQEGKQPAIYEDRLSIMLDDGKVPGFRQAGLLADLP